MLRVILPIDINHEFMEVAEEDFFKRYHSNLKERKPVLLHLCLWI